VETDRIEALKYMNEGRPEDSEVWDMEKENEYENT
jgi:hypothetical protein